LAEWEENAMLEGVARYFDLQSQQRWKMQTEAVGGQQQHAPVLPQYGALSLGVLVEPFLNNYVASGTFGFDLSGVALRGIFALLMAILLLPAVYKNAFDPEKPLLVQLCALFTSGVGWQSLFQTTATAVAGG
jgi:hypothetical protein